MTSRRCVLADGMGSDSQSQDARVPMTRPPRRPMSTGRRAFLAVALALVAVSACFAHSRWVDGALQKTQEEIQAATEPTKRLAELQKRSKEMETERGKLGTLLEKYNLQAESFQLQRQRMIRLMTCLSESKPDHLMVEKVESNAGEPRIFGVCWQPELADLFAAKLSLALPRHGWIVDTPKKKTQDLIDGGGPCAFEIQLHAIGGPPLDMSPSAAKGGLKIAVP